MTKTRKNYKRTNNTKTRKNHNGGNKIGHALYSVVGRAVGGVEQYKYSKSLAEY